jgi:hypothetical protein
MEQYLNKHSAVIQILGGIIATAVTLTAFAYTNFQTKTETQETIRQIEKHQQLILNTIEKRLERIENKLDQR